MKFLERGFESGGRYVRYESICKVGVYNKDRHCCTVWLNNKDVTSEVELIVSEYDELIKRVFGEEI